MFCLKLFNKFKSQAIVVLQEKDNNKRAKNEPTKYLSNKQFRLANMAGALPEEYIYGWSTKDQLQIFMNNQELAIKHWKNTHGESTYPTDGISLLQIFSSLVIFIYKY